MGTEQREHEWFKPDWLRPEWECCKVCGSVRLKGGIANKPCPGPVFVGPRDADKPDMPAMGTTYAGCPKCQDYVGKCPYCGSPRPRPQKPEQDTAVMETGEKL